MDTRVSQPWASASEARYLGFWCELYGLRGMRGMGSRGRRGGRLLEFSRLVSAVCETRVAVLSFGVDVDFSSERLGHAWQVLDGRGAEEK